MSQTETPFRNCAYPVSRYMHAGFADANSGPSPEDAVPVHTAGLRIDPIAEIQVMRVRWLVSFVDPHNGRAAKVAYFATQEDAEQYRSMMEARK
jgi:hypothetical protein